MTKSIELLKEVRLKGTNTTLYEVLQPAVEKCKLVAQNDSELEDCVKSIVSYAYVTLETKRIPNMIKNKRFIKL